VNFHAGKNGWAKGLADLIAGSGEFNVVFAILFGYDRYGFDA